MPYKTFIAFGDSITKGARTYLGYPELIGNALNRHSTDTWLAMNHSVNGFKAIDLTRYIDQHFSELKDYQSSISSIFIGTNDVKENTDPGDFLLALAQIIHKVKFLTEEKHVLILTIPDLQVGVINPYRITMNERIHHYNDLIHDTAEKFGIHCVDPKYRPDDFFDGIHLNRKGTEQSALQIVHYIRQHKEFQLG